MKRASKLRIYECTGEEGYHVTIKENVLFTKKKKVAGGGYSHRAAVATVR
jgi:hypothetical protein